MTISKETSQQQEIGFPISVFPEPIREIINETRSSLNYPTDFIAFTICFTLSIGIGNKFVAKVKEGWDERAILYMAIIGRSGVNKSHPLSFAMQPLFELDIKSSVKYQKEQKEYEKLLLCQNELPFNLSILPRLYEMLKLKFKPKSLASTNTASNWSSTPLLDV